MECCYLILWNFGIGWWLNCEKAACWPCTPYSTMVLHYYSQGLYIPNLLDQHIFDGPISYIQNKEHLFGHSIHACCILESLFTLIKSLLTLSLEDLRWIILWHPEHSRLLLDLMGSFSHFMHFLLIIADSWGLLVYLIWVYVINSYILHWWHQAYKENIQYNNYQQKWTKHELK